MVHKNPSKPWSRQMSATRPSTALLTTFVLAAAALFAAAATPLLHIAAGVIA